MAANGWLRRNGRPMPCGGWTPTTRPDWREACAKHLQLHQQGGSGQVFTFKEPFSADGDPVKLDAGRIKQIAAANAARLANITRAG